LNWVIRCHSTSIDFYDQWNDGSYPLKLIKEKSPCSSSRPA
jgi:hypothetical protein